MLTAGKKTTARAAAGGDGRLGEEGKRSAGSPGKTPVSSERKTGPWTPTRTSSSFPVHGVAALTEERNRGGRWPWRRRWEKRKEGIGLGHAEEKGIGYKKEKEGEDVASRGPHTHGHAGGVSKGLHVPVSLSP